MCGARVMLRRMRMFSCAMLFCGVIFAGDRPAAGIWKLDAKTSETKGCSADVLKMRIAEVPADLSNPPRPRKPAVNAKPTVARIDAPDSRTFTVTPVNRANCKLVYEKQ